MRKLVFPVTTLVVPVVTLVIPVVTLVTFITSATARLLVTCYTRVALLALTRIATGIACAHAAMLAWIRLAVVYWRDGR